MSEIAVPKDFCSCDYHDGWHGCLSGNQELVRRLRELERAARAFVATATDDPDTRLFADGWDLLNALAAACALGTAADRRLAAAPPAEKR